MGQSNKILIPNGNEIEIIARTELIRLEGMQRCTKVFLLNGTILVSSDNLGAFKKQLEDDNFFLPHKSHLINLDYVVRFNKEGVITMSDGAKIPLSRRQKKEFLEVIRRI